MKLILIVDDDAVSRVALSGVIKTRRPKARIVHAECGDSAWRVIQRFAEKPDIVISDVNMPGETDGVKLAEMIEQSCKGTHIILVSGNPEPNRHKAHNFLNKPVPVGVLMEIIENGPPKKKA